MVCCSATTSSVYHVKDYCREYYYDYDYLLYDFGYSLCGKISFCVPNPICRSIINIIIVAKPQKMSSK